jgi:hypothetical protein
VTKAPDELDVEDAEVVVDMDDIVLERHADSWIDSCSGWRAANHGTKRQVKRAGLKGRQIKKQPVSTHGNLNQIPSVSQDMFVPARSHCVLSYKLLRLASVLTYLSSRAPQEYARTQVELDVAPCATISLSLGRLAFPHRQRRSEVDPVERRKTNEEWLVPD